MRNQNSSNGKHILIVDDEPLVRRSLGEMLTLSGYTVSTVENGKEAIELLKSYNADIIISDLKMPEVDGVHLLKHVRNKYPDIPVILMTGYGSIENAVEAMKHGAYDYITKPIIDSEIKMAIGKIFKERELIEENVKLKEELSVSRREYFCGIVGKSSRMQKIYSLIEAITGTRANILIHGESGTGKHVIAHAIHKYNEKERGKPFVEVSCGALTETLLESELFGHVKGAFTGAIKDKPGRFELADGGTLFLDEIDAFSPSLQVKLLRVLQEGELERVGDTKTIKVDVRVIAATNQDLEELIKQDKFRNDLYYRLNIISIDVPSLRDRKEDIPLLINEFIKKHVKHTSKKISAISDEALSLLMGYDWPGNIRELENVIERAIILAKDNLINVVDMPESLIGHSARGRGENKPGCDVHSLKDALLNPEKELILNTLNNFKWNRNETARQLRINRTTLYKKMLKFGLLNNSSDDE